MCVCRKQYVVIEHINLFSMPSVRPLVVDGCECPYDRAYTQQRSRTDSSIMWPSVCSCYSILRLMHTLTRGATECMVHGNNCLYAWFVPISECTHRLVFSLSHTRRRAVIGRLWVVQELHVCQELQNAHSVFFTLSLFNPIHC